MRGVFFRGDGRHSDRYSSPENRCEMRVVLGSEDRHSGGETAGKLAGAVRGLLEDLAEAPLS